MVACSRFVVIFVQQMTSKPYALVELLGMGEVGLCQGRVAGCKDLGAEGERGGGGGPCVGPWHAVADDVGRPGHGHLLRPPPVAVVQVAVADLHDEHRGIARDAVRRDHVVEGPAHGLVGAVPLLLVALLVQEQA